MGRMSDISIRLDNLKEDLYNNGFHSESFLQECKLLCELGFVDEINCIIWDFEYYMSTNEGD